MDQPWSGKLAVCTPFGLYDSPAGGKRLPCVSVDWHRARMNMVVPMGHNLAEIRADGYETGEARNLAVKKAKEAGIRYLFFLDWDVLIPPMTLVRLVYLLENNPDFDVAAGLYCIKHDPAEPMVWREWGNGVSWDWTWGDVLTDVVGTGTGCMLIRMSLFDRIDGEKIPWFKTVRDYVEDGDNVYQRSMTDDLWFTKRAVDEVGAKIMLDTGILCGHMDNETGVVYTLPDDCLPMRRYRQKKEAAA